MLLQPSLCRVKPCQMILFMLFSVTAPQELSARTTDRSIIRAMMEGGTAKIYHCNDSDKCLKVVADTPVTISRDNALKSQITKLLASIQNKAVSDTPLDDKEKGFISSTT